MIHGCGLEEMAGLVPGSVDMILCDLPSGETNAAFDVPVDLARFFALARRCLKLDGTMLLMASSFRFAAQLVDHGQDWYRYDLVWRKLRVVGRCAGTFKSGSRNRKRWPVELELTKAAASIVTSDAPFVWKLVFFGAFASGMLILAVMMRRI